MDIREWKTCAREQLDKQTYAPRRLALIHAGVIFLALLAGTGINYYVNQQMNTAVGLSGMGTLSVLETVQTVLVYAINILQPFWQLGFVFAALQMARRVQVGPAGLTQGFRRFGPALRLMLLRGLIYGGLLVVCVYVSVMIYVVTPLAQPMMDLMLPLVQPDQTMEQMQELFWQLPVEQIMGEAAPMFIIVIPVCMLFLLPIYYRFRLADLVIMDKPGTGALAALMLSGAMTRKRRMKLLRLDLSFWWYFLLQLIGILLCDLDLLPWNVGMSGFAAYVLGCGIQMVAFWLAGSYFHTAWAVAYDKLLQTVQLPQPRSAPMDN